MTCDGLMAEFVGSARRYSFVLLVGDGKYGIGVLNGRSKNAVYPLRRVMFYEFSE
jgi:hypothetical protein